MIYKFKRTNDDFDFFGEGFEEEYKSEPIPDSLPELTEEQLNLFNHDFRENYTKEKSISGKSWVKWGLNQAIKDSKYWSLPQFNSANKQVMPFIDNFEGDVSEIEFGDKVRNCSTTTLYAFGQKLNEYKKHVGEHLFKGVIHGMLTEGFTTNAPHLAAYGFANWMTDNQWTPESGVHEIYRAYKYFLEKIFGESIRYMSHEIFEYNFIMFLNLIDQTQNTISPTIIFEL